MAASDTLKPALAKLEEKTWDRLALGITRQVDSAERRVVLPPVSEVRLLLTEAVPEVAVEAFVLMRPPRMDSPSLPFSEALTWALTSSVSSTRLGTGRLQQRRQLSHAPR